MIIRYDFTADKLDLSRFQKQAIRQVAQMRDLTYSFYFKDFKIIVTIVTPDNANYHLVNILLYDLISVVPIAPHHDSRFSNISTIVDLFETNENFAEFSSNNAQYTINIFSGLIKIFYKFNSLIVFS